MPPCFFALTLCVLSSGVSALTPSRLFPRSPLLLEPSASPPAATSVDLDASLRFLFTASGKNADAPLCTVKNLLGDRVEGRFRVVRVGEEGLEDLGRFLNLWEEESQREVHSVMLAVSVAPTKAQTPSAMPTPLPHHRMRRRCAVFTPRSLELRGGHGRLESG
jgi:hypothetical protein